VGCNLCVNVCPVENCITLKNSRSGLSTRARGGRSRDTESWSTHPNNPVRSADQGNAAAGLPE